MTFNAGDRVEFDYGHANLKGRYAGSGTMQGFSLVQIDGDAYASPVPTEKIRPEGEAPEAYSGEWLVGYDLAVDGEDRTVSVTIPLPRPGVPDANGDVFTEEAVAGLIEKIEANPPRFTLRDLDDAG